MKKITGIILVAIAALVLASCGTEQTEAPVETQTNSVVDLSQYAGEYLFYGTKMDDYYVKLDALEGTSTTLNADGTGYINWGESNKGEISDWTVEGNVILITAGETSFTGYIDQGVLLFEVGDVGASFVECYATEDADTSEMPQLTAKEWAAQITEGTTE